MAQRIIMALLALLGFSTGCGRVEYGCPNADFHISGRVVDPEGKPIPQIKISTDNYYTTFSDSEGNFTFDDNYISLPQTIHLSDIDGEQNGGEFEDRELDIGASYVQTKKGKNWYEGAYKAELGDVVLNQADDEDNEPTDERIEPEA